MGIKKYVPSTKLKLQKQENIQTPLSKKSKLQNTSWSNLSQVSDIFNTDLEQIGQRYLQQILGDKIEELFSGN